MRLPLNTISLALCCIGSSLRKAMLDAGTYNRNESSLSLSGDLKLSIEV
jgi:hypothetical protein